MGNGGGEKFWCLLCAEGLPHFAYSREAMANHLRGHHGVPTPEQGENYESDLERVNRKNLERRESETEQQRRERIVDWECEQAASEMEGIDTVEDFLRACGVSS